MTTLCLGWRVTHPVPVVLSDDGKDDRDVSHGMCLECRKEWKAAERAMFNDQQYRRYLREFPALDPRD